MSPFPNHRQEMFGFFAKEVNTGITMLGNDRLFESPESYVYDTLE